jgi:hypothetical protein
MSSFQFAIESTDMPTDQTMSEIHTTTPPSSVPDMSQQCSTASLIYGSNTRSVSHFMHPILTNVILPLSTTVVHTVIDRNYLFGSFEITSIRLYTPLRNPLRYAGYTVCTTVVDKARISFVKTHGVHETANTSCVAAIYEGGGATLLWHIRYERWWRKNFYIVQYTYYLFMSSFQFAIESIDMPTDQTMSEIHTTTPPSSVPDMPPSFVPDMSQQCSLNQVVHTLA